MSRRTLLWVLGAVATIAVVVIGVVVVMRVTRDRGPEVIVLRPVDAQGNVQDGWQQKTDDRNHSPIDCSYGDPSPYDVDSTVLSCGGTAEAGDACWPAADTEHVLCLRDPFTRAVDLLRAKGLAAPRKAPQHGARPFALVLDDGRHCRARIGGAWGRPADHPDWVGYYSCGNASVGYTNVWAPLDEAGPGDGISRSDDGWSVMVSDGQDPLSPRRVTQVYYVGVAG